MIGNSTAETRLCPYCANSIPEDAATCSYCKAEFSSQFTPEWLKRDETSSRAQLDQHDRRRFPMPPKLIWVGAMLALAVSAFFAGAYLQRSRDSLSSQANLKQLQAKEQMIQTQEAQLAQTRQQLNESSQQLAETKAKLEANQKELSLTQQRLKVVARPADRPSSSRFPVATRTSARTPDTAAPPPAAPAGRSGAPEVYQTTRATSVHEHPSASAPVISKIESGTRINVVNSSGGWLEVRSRRGNPPGYVRSADARPMSAVN